MKIVLCERLSSIDRDYKVEHWEYESDLPTVAFRGPEDEAKVIAAAFVRIGYRDLSDHRCHYCGDLVVPPDTLEPGSVEGQSDFEKLCPGCRQPVACEHCHVAPAVRYGLCETCCSLADAAKDRAKYT